MKLEKDAIHELLIRYDKGECTESEKELLERWYLQFEDPSFKISPEQIKKLGKDVFRQLPGNKEPIIKTWYVVAAVAACILVAIGIRLYRPELPITPTSTRANDVPPGGNQATLTLANGKTIKLSNAKTGIIINTRKLTYSDGTNIAGAAINKGTQTISTPKGGQYQVVLPDGSKVWLNAATTLKYPPSFAGSVIRKVELEGEAYFEVAKDKAHPFIVKSKLQELQVLGTHFNISAYEDEAITKSTLIEGSIKINTETILKPGDEATNSGTTIHVEQVDTDNAVAWKNGEFMFRKETLKSIMQKIIRWYDVEVVYEDHSAAKKLFGGEISRFTNVSEVLKMLELTGQVHFTIKGRRIMVKK